MAFNFQLFAVPVQLLLICSAFASDPSVTVERGKITGKQLKFEANGVEHSVDAYLGIRCAEPPVGPLRFKPPVPNGWQGEINAQKYGSLCPQPLFPEIFPFQQDDMDEDCLVLNVFVPQPTPKNAAVMYWIHGGGYQFGAGSYEEGMDSHAMAQLGNVIIVAINYRLNVLGFLNTEDGVVAGNMGMLDQVEGLKWVQKNIAAFGGDPGRVTIFGESAGGGSVSLHTLSPLSDGLYSGAIQQSGVANAPWATNPVVGSSSRAAFAIGKAVGCDDAETTQQLVDCLMDVPASDLVNASSTYVDMEDPSVQIAFAPVIDGNFLPEHPSELMKKGSFNKANIMSGYNADEGMMSFLMFYPNSTEKPHLNKTEYEQFLTFSKFPPFLNPLQRAALELVYFDDDVVASPDPNYFDLTAAILGDFYFGCVNDVYLHSAYEAATVGSTYAYYFNHHPSFSFLHAPWSGACHGDDLMFFGYHFLPNNHSLTEVEVDMTMKMIRFWTNFAKTGNPNIGSLDEEPEEGMVWPQYTPNEKMYQELSPDMNVIPDPIRARCRLFNEYIPKLEAAIGAAGECHQDKTCNKWSEDGDSSCIGSDTDSP